MTAVVPELKAGEGFELGPEDEAALLESIREADAGELIDGDDVLRVRMRSPMASYTTGWL